MAQITLAALQADYMERFSAEAYRLETLDYYDSDLYRDRLAGRPIERGGWDDFIRRARLAGKRMSRVHVVTEPLTGYLRHELDFYQGSIRAGEDIRIIRRSDSGGLGLPDFDYWLFDERTAAVMNYDSDGICTGADVITDSQFVAECIRWRDAAVAHSLSLDDYQAGKEAAA